MPKRMLRHTGGTMAAPAADKDVMVAVERALMADASLDGIRLTSVEDGLVLLAGSTTSLVHELRAIGAVYRIPGVRYVASGIEAEDE